MSVNYDEKLGKLRNALADNHQNMENILSKAQSEDRDLSDDEAEMVDAFQQEHQRLANQIELYEKQIVINSQAEETQARVTSPDDTVEPEEMGTVQAEVQPEQSAVAFKARKLKQATSLARGKRLSENNILGSSRFGFATMGEWAHSVVRASTTHRVDDRLKVVEAAQEKYGEDGGFLVPPDFASTIVEVVLGDSVASLASRCWQIPVAGNMTSIPLNMDTPYGNGIRAYWGGEMSKHRQTSPNIEQADLKLHKITAMVPVTEELLEDAPAIGSVINSKAPGAIAWEIGDAIINGDGVGKPLGIMNSRTKATITVAKTSGQSDDTITKENAYNMFAALPAASQMSAVWLVSPSAQPVVWDLTYTNRGDPGRGVSDEPYQSLLNRPVIQHLALAPLGDKGDIVLADFSKYAFVYKTTGVRSAMSMHMMFDQDVMMLKFQMRCNGLATWSKQTSVATGSHKLSPFVTLGAR